MWWHGTRHPLRLSAVRLLCVLQSARVVSCRGVLWCAVRHRVGRPAFNATVGGSVLTSLFVEMVKDAFNEQAYLAEQASIGCDLRAAQSQHIEVCLGGFSEHLLSLAQVQL